MKKLSKIINKNMPEKIQDTFQNANLKKIIQFYK